MAQPRKAAHDESAPLLALHGPVVEQAAPAARAAVPLAAAGVRRRDTAVYLLAGIVLDVIALAGVVLVIPGLAWVIVALTGVSSCPVHDLPSGAPRTTGHTMPCAAQMLTETFSAKGAPLVVGAAPSDALPCLTPNCVILAASILSSLDTTQNPCDDFYLYANGGWLKSNPLPASKAGWSQFDELARENVRIVSHIIAQDVPGNASPDDAATLKKLKDMHRSCMDDETLDALGHGPLLELHRGAAQQGLTSAVSYLHARGVEALFRVTVDGDAGYDPNFLTLHFGQGGLGLPAKSYYEDQAVLDVYTQSIKRVMVAVDEPIAYDLLPPENKRSRAAHLAGAVVDFEVRLAKAHLDLDKLYQDPFGTYNPTPFDNFTRAIPEIDWSTYVAAFAPPNLPQKIIVSYPPYIHSLSKLLKDTNAEVIEAYLVSRLSLSLAPYLGLSTEVWQAKRELDELLKGLKKGAMNDREEFCLQRVEATLGFAAGRFFVQETFGGDSRQQATKIIEDIINAFKGTLPDLKWMDKESADIAATKAANIRPKVGYPLHPDATSDHSIASYYNLVRPNHSTFLANTVQSSKTEQLRTWSTLGTKRNRDTWRMMFPTTADAFFYARGNEIVFPAGILRPPFFSQEWPNYLSYGSFGGVAAHELCHAFDSAGRMYNPQGKLEQWWTNGTSERFDERKNCISGQYSDYTVNDGKGGVVHVNGNLTSGENIADAGLINAYRAWKKQENESLASGSEYLLPGLQNYTR